MYAVVEPDRLKELNRFAKSIDKSFDLLTPFDEILKKKEIARIKAEESKKEAENESRDRKFTQAMIDAFNNGPQE